MVTTASAERVVQAYHRAWTSGDFEQATQCLAADLEVEVPIHEYPTRESFANALRRFGSMVERVDLVASCAESSNVVLIYDMTVRGMGTLRVAEQFTVNAGRIVVLRQIHDTAPIRAWLATESS